jgi:DNA polymerase-1
MEAYGLSQRLSVGVGEASGILDAYFVAFPNVKQYMDETVEQARKRGYTETLFGRRRPIPELNSSNFRIRQAGERQAMNAGIQGLAADIFKIALVRISDAFETANLKSRVILQVHDEVIIEAVVSEKSTVEEIVLTQMKQAASLKVPLEVHSAWGTSWASAKG